MAAPHLRLVSHEVAPAPSERRAPPLSVIEGTPAPAEPDREWHWTPAGQLLPRTHRFDRIRLSRDKATKRWRELAGELDAATDQIAATDGSYEALGAWRTIAANAIIAPLGKSAAANLDRLRTKLALAAVLSGAPFRYGMMHEIGPGSPPATIAWGLLDHAVFQLIYQPMRGDSE
jgi:hypothetical protein